MPEVGPRIHNLFMGGLGYVPFFIAVVYQMVGLLPRNHPYLVQSNIGLYGVRHVVAEAANNLTFSLRNIDQIVLFFAVIAGLLLFFIQIIALAAMVFFQPAFAAMPTDWSGFFSITNPGYRSHDLAFIMLDMVFGVPHPSLTNGGGNAVGFFESCVGLSGVTCQNNFGVDIADTNAPGTLGSAVFSPLSSNAHSFFPFPYHVGIHRLFAVYSNGLLVIAVFITSYFVATILAETAQTGTPFGRRFNKTWAPLRLVMAFGLLMPLTVGLNSSQYVVLYAAKYGSAFASNGWRIFLDTIGTNNVVADSSLIMTPSKQDLRHITHFMYVARVCKQVQDHYTLMERRLETGNNAYVLTPDEMVQGYIMGVHNPGNPANQTRLMGTGALDDYEDFRDYLESYGGLGATDRGVIRFGVKNEDKYGTYKGFVSPICGEMVISLTEKRDRSSVGAPTGPGIAEPGPWHIQVFYYELVRALWYELHGIYDYPGATQPTRGTNSNHRVDYRAVQSTNGLRAADVSDYGVPLDNVYVTNVNDLVYGIADIYYDNAVTAQRGSTTFSTYPKQDSGGGTVDSPLYDKGWAAAGVWYNSISDMNGSIVASAYAVPYVSKYPLLMEAIAEKKTINDKDVEIAKQFEPTLVNSEDITPLLGDGKNGEFAKTLWAAYKEWGEADGANTRQRQTGNAFLDAVSLLFGTNGLYDLRRNPDTHPLAMLSGVGRALVESAIRNIGWAAVGTVASGLKGFFGEFAGKLGNIAASFLVSVAMLGLTVGFVLFYVVPFLPFIYFFFAVGGWIKGIFEALVGAPLWALAHIRIDGNGLPGNAALNGYFLIFEVFLRPILIVFGLLASISTYSALVSVLNSIFPLVVENAAGYDLDAELNRSGGPGTVAAGSPFTIQYLRSRIDEFFFTILYAIIVYLLGMASFKLIDLIPNNILRWMGQSVATFGDQREDPAQGLVSRASVGSQQALGKIGGGLQGVVKAAS
ncbi:MAG: DotA/TraY family protein [Alphaproteobacteria bacterium]